MLKINTKNDQSGATIVEFSIVVILLITLLFAIIEFGLLIFNKNIITHASREGARHGIVYRPADSRVTVGEIQSVSKHWSESNVVSLGKKNTPLIEVSNNPEGASTACINSNDFLIVTVSHEYSFLFIPLATINLQSTSTMRCE